MPRASSSSSGIHSRHATTFKKSPTMKSLLLVLEMLNSSQTLKFSIDHDSQPSAQGLTLLHAAEYWSHDQTFSPEYCNSDYSPMGGQDHTPAISNNLSDGVPKKASGRRIHSRGGLI